MRKRYAVGVISPQISDFGRLSGDPIPIEAKLLVAPDWVNPPPTKGASASPLDTTSPRE